jgi:hypothetical protein
MKTTKGTPKTIEEAIANGLEQLGIGKPTPLAINLVKQHIRDFVAQKATCLDDDKKSNACIELFQTIFGERPKGYLVALQWYQGAKHLNDFRANKFNDKDAMTVCDLCGVPDVRILESRPRCPIGTVLFRVNHDDSLTMIEANYDTAD